MFRRTAIAVVVACLAWLVYSFLREGPREPRISGPIIHDRVAPFSQDIDLRNPPHGYQPLVWTPGDPIVEPGDFGFAEKFTIAGESWFRRWLRKLCCAIFSCQPEPPQLPPDDGGEPTVIALGVEIDGIPGTGKKVPDPVGDIGPDHYVQAVNSAFQIFGAGGNTITQPQNINVLWDGTNTYCKNEPPADPVVRYDKEAQRWLISGFIWNTTPRGEHYLCIAISKNADPVEGGWFVYQIQGKDPVSGAKLPIDSPKVAVWPDAYYLSTFQADDLGLDVWAFERSKMLAGQAVGIVRFHVGGAPIALLPGDPDGLPPPAGSPGWYARQVDGERVGNGADRVEVYAFSVDWTSQTGSTFVLKDSLPVDPFDSVFCMSDDVLDYCVPQPDTTQKLETLAFWPQWRLQYRNFGDHESLLFNHTIDVDGNGHAGIRWYELRRPPGGGWSVAQQGTHQDQDLDFFMGGISMDGKGNIALGYTASSATVHPGIRIAHRMAGDAPGSMPGTEYLAVAGSGSQLDPNGRWGNYTTMDVDPDDDCTFWYTNEYYLAPSTQAGWLTKIVSFKLPGCQ